MSVEVSKDDKLIRVSGKLLELVWDKAAGSYIISRQDEKVRFGPLHMQVRLDRADGRTINMDSSLLSVPDVQVQDSMDTPLGATTGIRAKVKANVPYGMTLEVAAFEDKDYVLARMILTNNDLGPAKVYEMSPMSYTGADPGLELGPGYGAWKFYRTGFQSWSPAGSIGVLEPDYKPNFFLPRKAGVNPRTGYSKKSGEKASDWMAQLVEPSQKLSLLAGFVTSARQLGRLEFQVKYDRFRKLQAFADGDGAQLDPGRSIESEWILVSLSDDPLAAQEEYYEVWGRIMGARKTKPLTGWCSWYYYYWNIDEEKLDLNLKHLEKFKGLIDMVQLDDGYQPYLGEWIDWNIKFPSPAKSIVKRIHDAGFKAGIWMAPFLISRKAPVYRNHPDWIIRCEKGLPVVANLHPQWKGNVMYALDPTHPGVQEWLRESVKTLMRDYGFDFLKIDFIYAASLPGLRYDPHSTGAMALRKGLEIIREAAGEEKIILGCGAPLGPSVGLVDANRVSQDVDIHWDYPLVGRIAGVPVHPSAKNALKNNLTRSLMHDKLWTNDPDCLVLRDSKYGMSLDAIRSELSIYYLSGGFMLISEDMTKLPKERMELFRQALPLGGRAAKPLDLFEKDFPEIFFLKGEQTSLVALYNWSDSIKTKSLKLKRLGLDGPCHVFDYWGKKYLGLVEDILDLGQVPSRGCKYLAITPASDRPRVIGLDFHLGMGTVGLEHGAGKDKSLNIEINIPGAREGRVWVAFPDGTVCGKELDFEDVWKGRVLKSD